VIMKILIGNPQARREILVDEDEFSRFLTILAMAPATPPHPFMPQSIALSLDAYGSFAVDSADEDWDYVRQYINEGDVPTMNMKKTQFFCFGWFDRSEDEVVLIVSDSLRTDFVAFMLDIEQIREMRIFDAPVPFK